MPTQAVYIHGNAITMRFPGGKGDPVGSPHTPGHQMNGVFAPEGQIEWSDVVGLHGPEGTTFRGRRGSTNTFFAPVPTLVWRDYMRAKLARVGIKFATDSEVFIVGMRIFDGARRMDFPFPSLNLTGNHSFTWDANINYFDHPSPPEIESCICVVFDVRFASEGNVTFNAVGCDLIVEVA